MWHFYTDVTRRKLVLYVFNNFYTSLLYIVYVQLKIKVNPITSGIERFSEVKHE